MEPWTRGGCRTEPPRDPTRDSVLGGRGSERSESQRHMPVRGCQWVRSGTRGRDSSQRRRAWSGAWGSLGRPSAADRPRGPRRRRGRQSGDPPSPPLHTGVRGLGGGLMYRPPSCDPDLADVPQPEWPAMRWYYKGGTVAKHFTKWSGRALFFFWTGPSCGLCLVSVPGIFRGAST